MLSAFDLFIEGWGLLEYYIIILGESKRSAKIDFKKFFLRYRFIFNKEEWRDGDLVM